MPMSTRLLLAAIASVLLVMLTYVLIGFTPLGSILGVFGNDASGREKAEGSLQMAVDACKTNVRNSLGSSLLQTKVDYKSTRYNLEKQVYQVFINLVIEGSEREDTYLQCDVSAVSQRIIRTRVTGGSNKFSLI